MAERKSFSFIDFLDQAVCDLIGDGADKRKDQRVSTAAAPVRFRADLTAIDEILAWWSDEQIARLGCSTAGTTSKKKQHKVTMQSGGVGLQGKPASDCVLLQVDL